MEALFGHSSGCEQCRGELVLPAPADMGPRSYAGWDRSVLGEGLTYFHGSAITSYARKGAGCVHISRSELLGVCTAPDYPQLRNYCLRMKHTYNGNIHHMVRAQD